MGARCSFVISTFREFSKHGSIAIHKHDHFSSFRFHPCLDPIDIDNHRDSAHQPAGQFEEERIVAAGGDERQPERATVERPQRQ